MFQKKNNKNNIDEEILKGNIDEFDLRNHIHLSLKFL